MCGKIYPAYIINELRKPYVQTQLEHWSHSAEGYHSEDEILDLMIYVPVAEHVVEVEEDICKKELDQSILPIGYEINNFYAGDEYIIKKCLGRGGFGISYLAKKSNYMSEEKCVVLKEYLAVGFRGQESQRDSNHWVSIKLGDIDEIKSESSVYTYLVKFIEEAELMHFFGRFPGSRIRTASKIFKYDETNTCYYEMEYYKNGTLMDELENNGLMSEEEAVKRVMCPLARAIKTMHDNKWLHLDIKAENVLMDDDGIAVLGDLGISQQYDSSGKKLTKGGGLGSSGACELQFNEIFTREFHPELDIYSLAAMYYFILTGKTDHRSFDPFDLNEFEYISDKSKNAIIKSLDPSLKNTPKDIISFMRMLPGCEDFNLAVIEPEPEVDDDFDLDFDDLDFDDFDLPDFDSGLIPSDSGDLIAY
jgi:serine/threonine protein kinase